MDGGHPSERCLRPRTIGAICVLLFGVAVLYAVNVNRILAHYADFYSVPYDAGGFQEWRQRLLDDRIRQYVGFLFFVAGGTCIVAIVVALGRRIDAYASRLRLSRPATIAVIAGSLVVLTMFAGWLSDQHWRSFGSPCWDGYCDYGRLIVRWMDTWGSDNATAALRTFLHSNYHANSPLEPVLSALISVSTGTEVINAYRLIVALASLGTVVIVWLSILPRWEQSLEIRVAQVVLLLSNIAFVRSSFFPQTDALVLVLSTAVLAVAIPYVDAPSWGRRLELALLGVTGVFAKLSFLPALLVVPLWHAAVDYWARRPWSAIVRALVVDSLLFVGLPLAAFACFQIVMGTMPMYQLEVTMAHNIDFYAPFVLGSLCAVTAPTLLLMWIGRRRQTHLDHLLLMWVALYLLALWGSRAAGQNRYYLAIVPACAILAGHGLARLRANGHSVLWAFVAIDAVLNYDMMLRPNMFY